MNNIYGEKMMKICSRCGYQNTDNSGYCEKCGQQLLQQPDRSVQNRMDYGQQEQNPMHYEQQGAQGQRQRGNGQRNIAWNQSGQTIAPPKKKKKTGLIIAIVILVAAILLLVAAFLFRDKIKEVISEHFPSIVTEQQEPEKEQAKTEQDNKKKETVETDAQPETDDAETQTVSDVQPDAQIACWYGEKEGHMKKAIQKLRAVYPKLSVRCFPIFGHGDIINHPTLLVSELKCFCEL